MASLLGIKVVYETGELAVTLDSGEVRTTSADPAIFEGLDRFQSTELSFVDDTLDIITAAGERFVVEAPPTRSGTDPRQGRRAVYLDQNHWIYLSRALVGAPVSEDRMEVAAYLRNKVGQGQVLLPLSLAHHVEAGFKGGPPRERLAGIMLQLSRGWVMKHPLRVRREELQGVANRSLNDVVMELPDVVSTIPWLRYEDQSLAPDLNKVSDFPRPLQRWWAVVVSVVTAYDTLLDPVRDDAAALKKSANEWAAEISGFAIGMAKRGLSSEQKRAAAFTRMIRDMGPDILRAYFAAGGDLRGFGAWLSSLDREDFAHVPYLNRWFTVFGDRLSNPHQPWEANDLFDLMYLPCAAAYCDVVVAEKSMAHYLKLADREQIGAAIVTDLRELPDVLER